MAPGKHMSFSDVRKNVNGGYYQQGKCFDICKKEEIVSTFFQKWEETYPDRPSYSEIARQTKTTHTTVRKFMKEFESLGRLVNPEEEKWIRAHSKKNLDKVLYKLSHEEESFLLSLRAEDPSRPDYTYVEALQTEYSKEITVHFLKRWFKYRFKFAGNFRKASMVPLDKFKESNWFRYYEYRMVLNLIENHEVFNFIDEKHIANFNGHEQKVRRDPITGVVPAIKVSGNFRESYSIIAAISPNPNKEKHAFATVGQKNNDSNAFMVFVESMIIDGFLKHNEIVVMDNAAIHTSASSNIIQEFLWNHEVDNRPLNILVLFLPPRSPELNPIELIFNILSSRVKSYRYRKQGAPLPDIVERVHDVFDNIDLGLIQRCCQHCGYHINDDEIMDEF